MHRKLPKVAPKLHQNCTKISQSCTKIAFLYQTEPEALKENWVRQCYHQSPYVVSAPKMHQNYTKSAPKVHSSKCITEPEAAKETGVQPKVSAPNLHQICTKRAPNLHQNYVTPFFYCFRSA